MLGAPYFEEMKLNLENGKTFVVKAPKVSAKNKYVQSVTLNGKPYNKAFITSSDILNGGELVFSMGSKPNKKRVYKADDKPFSMTK